MPRNRRSSSATTPPASQFSPAHGPWRRLQAQAVEADRRFVPELGELLLLLAGLVKLQVLGLPCRGIPAGL